MGVKGCTPLGCFPLWGREGVTLTNSMSFHRSVFYKAEFLYRGLSLKTKNRIYPPGSFLTVS